MSAIQRSEKDARPLEEKEQNVDSQIDLIIVDDEAEIGDIIQVVAEGCGLKAVVVTTAAKFRESVDKHKAASVVMDIIMPDSDGIELLRWLIDRGGVPRIGFMSGFDQAYMNAAIKLASLAGVDVFGSLVKPANLDEIKKFLSPLIQR